MAFIKESDYAHIVDQESLNMLAPEAGDRIKAENAAMEEMSSYLRGRYDVETLFQQTGNARNQLLLMYLIDMAVYHLFARLETHNGVPEARKERYKAAIAWLLDVADGKSNPNLPTYPEEEDETGIKFGSIEKQTNIW